MWVHSDIAIVNRILANFISNAIRYTDRGKILVGVRRSADSLCLQVWDTGLGIKSEHLGDIYQEYFQVNNSGRDNTKGLGLGLSIVRGLAQRVDAQLHCHSVIGLGSCFAVTLNQWQAERSIRH